MKVLFKKSRLSSEFTYPDFEHTYLINIPKNSNPELIQAAYKLYPCTTKSINFQFLEKHLSYLQYFDRNTILKGKELQEWITLSNFGVAGCENESYIGQLISFTCYKYWSDNIQLLFER